MNKYDLAGMLKTYSERCGKAGTDAQLKEIVRKLKEELRAALEGGDGE